MRKHDPDRIRLERKAAIGSLGVAALRRDATRRGIKVTAKTPKADIAAKLKADPIIAKNRQAAAEMIRQVRRQLVPGRTLGPDAIARLDRQLESLERLNLDEATLKQLRKTREALAKGADAGRAFTGRSAKPKGPSIAERHIASLEAQVARERSRRG